MNVVEISKYRPALMKQGRYLREDWVSYSSIGEVFDGRVLTRGEYLRVENHYVDALEAVLEYMRVSSVLVHDVERWDLADDILRRHQLDDVIDDSPRPSEGEELSGMRLQNVFRRCLREVAWLELVVPNSLLIHLSHDLRLIVGLELDPAPLRSVINALGLYIYPSFADLPTLEAWRAADSP